LSKVLLILSFYHINLTKIQSLPIIGREWEYQFYINLTFDDIYRYRQALDAIRPLIKDFKNLGEFKICIGMFAYSINAGANNQVRRNNG